MGDVAESVKSGVAEVAERWVTPQLGLQLRAKLDELQTVIDLRRKGQPFDAATRPSAAGQIGLR